MSGGNLLVLLGGLTAIAFVNWWFFRAGRRPVAAASSPAGGPQEILVAVRGGYDPGSIRVRAGQPVRLVFLVVGPPAEAGRHVQVLGRIARLAQRTDLRERLLAAESAGDFAAVIKESEES